MTFNGTCYCYYYYGLNSSEQAQAESLIASDYCSQLFESTAHVVKISEPGEYGYLRQHFGEGYLGATLQSGTTYQWYVSKGHKRRLENGEIEDRKSSNYRP